MDVNTNLATISPAVQQQPKTPVKTELENDNNRDDTITLSTKAQQLNRAFTQQNSTVPSISKREQARNTVNWLVTDIQNQPDAAMSAVSIVNSDMVRNFLG